jgi:T-complex protein 1 subunit delta
VQITSSTGQTIISNDGATILQRMEVQHPTAKMLVQLSKAQDVEAGDGTTSVAVIAGSLLSACQQLISKGMHPTIISESFQIAFDKAVEKLKQIAIPVNLNEREALIRAAVTSLNSKVVSAQSAQIAPIAVDAVLKVIDPSTATNCDLRDVRVVSKLGGTVEDMKLSDGLVFYQKASHAAGGPTRVEKAKIGLIQFCLSAPKADMEQSVVVTNYQQMDRILKEERQYILNLVKKIKESGCNVLLIQKSILRDATNDLSLHFLAKAKIMVIRDVERDEIEFVCKTLGCTPVASPDHMTADKLGYADLVDEIRTGEGSIVEAHGVQNAGKTVSILVRASNRLFLDEADRSLHDALCVIRSLVKCRYLIAGGGAPEMAVSVALNQYAKSIGGQQSYCIRAFAEALEIIPYTLAENAGLNPIVIVTELRKRHTAGDYTAGINVKKGAITDILEENVIQPLLVNLSALGLATETVRMVLKIDDIVGVR